VKTHRRLWLILTVLGAVAVLVAGTAVGVKALTGERLLGCLLRRDDRTLENVLAAADEELSRGYASRAETTLDQGYAGARGEGETLRLLKRELALAEATGSYRRLARQARKAWDRLPGSPRLAKVAAWAALRAEDPQGAGTLLSRSSRFGELDGLRAEAFLRGWLAELRLSGSAPDRLRTLTELPTVRDPAALRTLADVIGEPRLDLDAALEWMREGRAGEAFAALWPRRENPAITEALLFIALDAGHYTEAWDLLARQAQSSELPDRLVLGGDIACLLGMRDQAAVRYQEAIQLDPGYSWVPYLNLAAILETSGDREGARDFRRRAYARFPERGEVVLAHARDLAAAGERGRARELVEGLLARDPSQVSAPR
jgi:tetratricopeptide (TPR) repeat protein